MPPPRPAPRTSDPADAGRAPSTAPKPLLVWIAGWLVPGLGHLLVGQLQKALVFFVVLTAMFMIGVGYGGRLFPFQLGDPLVFLAALSEWALGLPRLLAAMSGAGKGQVTSVTYEYGNTFLIAAGLLNLLVAFNASDLAAGRLPARSRAAAGKATA
jgi:hypothetical protein